MEIFVIVGIGIAAYVGFCVFVWSLCAISKRSDNLMAHAHDLQRNDP